MQRITELLKKRKETNLALYNESKNGTLSSEAGQVFPLSFFAAKFLAAKFLRKTFGRFLAISSSELLKFE